MKCKECGYESDNSMEFDSDGLCRNCEAVADEMRKEKSD